MTRARIMVEIDCDAVPGMFHDPEDHRRFLENVLGTQLPHYHPKVTLEAHYQPHDLISTLMTPLPEGAQLQ